jgi:ketosteroid isomerase-like protein
MRTASMLLLASAALYGCPHAPAARPLASDREALLAADAQFARDTAARGAEGWASWFAEDGFMFPAGKPAVQGRNDIRDLMSNLRDPRTGRGELTLEWEPIGGDVSSSGDLGWTYGSYRAATAQGERRGKYLTVWRRQPDGIWRVQADLGNPGPPAAPKPAP